MRFRGISAALVPFLLGLGGIETTALAKHRLATDTRALLTRPQTYWILGAGLGGAWATHHFDADIATSSFNANDSFFKAGSVLGGPAQVGALFATYGLGRLFSRPQVTQVGGDLVRASVLTHSITMAIKISVARQRPDRSNKRSFPSGHASGSFATATVLHAWYGWKVGVPSGVLASYIAVSRLNTGRHYLSDIVFGTALGIVVGQTVTRDLEARRWVLGPVPIRNGLGVRWKW